MPMKPPSDVDLAAIVARLKEGGRLRRDELESVRRKLAEASNDDDDDLYNLARALGLGAPPSRENVQLLEPLLSLSTEEWGLHGVIIALCIDWGLAKHYIGKLREMSGPRAWESHQSAAVAALAALGNYLQHEDDRDAVGVLLEYIESASQSLALVESASLREYRNAVWHALDQWVRGRQALVQPTRFDPSSQSYRRVLERFRALDS